MSYQPLLSTHQLSTDVPTHINENFRRARFLNRVTKGASFDVWDAADDSSGAPVDVYIVTAVATASLPAANSTDAAAGRVVTFINTSVGNVTLDADGTDEVEGAGTLVLATGTRATIISDGTADWYRIAEA